MAEPDILDVLASLLETDRTFYNSARFLNYHREAITIAHQRNTAAILAILRNYMQDHTQTVMNITLPANWADPVSVVPTGAQIEAATSSVDGVEDTTCSICQESLTEGTQITACRHTFHTSCISEWFSLSPRCPMCRADIRETASVSGQTQPQENNPQES